MLKQQTNKSKLIFEVKVQTIMLLYFLNWFKTSLLIVYIILSVYN